MRDRVRLVTTGAQLLGERREVLRCLRRQFVACLARLQFLRMLHDGAEQPQGLSRTCQETFEIELVDNRGSVREVGVYVETVKVADHEQRGILERLAVLQQLVIGCLQVLVLALVLPGEVAALPHVGEAVATAGLLRALLKGVPVAGRVGLVRRHHAEHAAKVDEVLL